jgi:hypothetical protein
MNALDCVSLRFMLLITPTYFPRRCGRRAIYSIMRVQICGLWSLREDIVMSRDWMEMVWSASRLGRFSPWKEPQWVQVPVETFHRRGRSAAPAGLGVVHTVAYPLYGLISHRKVRSKIMIKVFYDVTLSRWVSSFRRFEGTHTTIHCRVPEDLNFQQRPFDDLKCRTLNAVSSTDLTSPSLWLTPWSRVLPEKLTHPKLLKKFLAFYGTRRFFTAFTNARHPYLSWARSIQSMTPQPISRRSILVLSFHLHLGLSSGLLLSGFLT